MWLIGPCIGDDNAIKKLIRDDSKFAREATLKAFPDADLHCEFPDAPVIIGVSVVFKYDQQKRRWTGNISKATC